MYKTIIVKYSPKAKEMAARIEAAAIKWNRKDLNLFLVLLHLLPREFWFLDRQRLPNHPKFVSTKKDKIKFPPNLRFLPVNKLILHHTQQNHKIPFPVVLSSQFCNLKGILPFCLLLLRSFK